MTELTSIDRSNPVEFMIESLIPVTPIDELKDIGLTPDTTSNSISIPVQASTLTSIPIIIAQKTGSLAFYAATSSIGRKAIFTGAMYLAGGTIISTIGLVPVIVAGIITWTL